MSVKGPKEIVAADFGGRDKLIDELLTLLEAKDDDTKRRLRAASNAKLLTLHRAGTEVRQRFQSKENLINQIAAEKFKPGRPDSDYVEKISSYSVKRLLDLHRQVASSANPG